MTPRRTAALCVSAALASCRGGSSNPAPDPPPRTALTDAGGAPTARPPRPLTPASLDALATLSIAGAQVAPIARGPTDLALAITTSSARVVLTASPCLACTPPTLAAWQPLRPTLAALYAPGADTDPPTTARLSISTLSLASTDAIAIDALRADGSVTAIAHWNDGATQLQAICELPASIDPSPCTPVLGPALTAALAALAR